MLKLMNSAVMPAEGVYIVKRISIDEAKAIFAQHDKFESYIGYPETAAFLSKVFGCEIPVSRAETTLEDGDEMLVCRLKYRITDPKTKGTFVPSESDYEFMHVKYEKRR